MPKVNPEILRWARQTAGLDLETAAGKVGLKAARGQNAAERLRDLEAGAANPTRPLLVRMCTPERLRASLSDWRSPLSPSVDIAESA